LIAALALATEYLHYGGADENAPLLFVVGVGVLVGLFLAWRRGRRDE
jgi:LPXTG-motif cell wall-anchored protein